MSCSELLLGSVMGFFDIIKDAFSKREEKVEEISLAELKDWYSEKHSAIISKTKDQLGGEVNRIISNTEVIREKLKELETGTLRNTNIPKKAIDVME